MLRRELGSAPVGGARGASFPAAVCAGAAAAPAAGGHACGRRGPTPAGTGKLTQGGAGSTRSAGRGVAGRAALGTEPGGGQGAGARSSFVVAELQVCHSWA